MISFDKSWIDKVINEYPYVKLLSIPKFNEVEKRWECLAQVNTTLAFIEVTEKDNDQNLQK